MSEIPVSTIKAYLDTDYCVFGEFPFILRVGIASEPLAKLYKQFGTNCGIFVTAFNPFSINVGEAANSARQVELTKELNRGKLTYFRGIGKHPSGEWAESSCFVLGVSLEAAKVLGKKYDQNAVVWCGSDAIPELILLR